LESTALEDHRTKIHGHLANKRSLAAEIERPVLAHPELMRGGLVMLQHAAVSGSEVRKRRFPFG
jgi:hypothetical protein